MKKALFFFLIVYFFVSCSSPNKIPDDIIGIDKMKLICWDLTRAGKLAQIENEKAHRIYFAKGKSILKDTARSKKNKRSDTTSLKKDTSNHKKDTTSLKLLTTQAFQQVFDL